MSIRMAGTNKLEAIIFDRNGTSIDDSKTPPGHNFVTPLRMLDSPEFNGKKTRTPTIRKMKNKSSPPVKNLFQTPKKSDVKTSPSSRSMGTPRSLRSTASVSNYPIMLKNGTPKLVEYKVYDY